MMRLSIDFNWDNKIGIWNGLKRRMHQRLIQIKNKTYLSLMFLCLRWEQVIAWFGEACRSYWGRTRRLIQHWSRLAFGGETAEDGRQK
mmetsp:Transcript_48420/g.67281  ORF Transcript_48420/g.67281 Transcript_48420/m.67281 type:complete len:88 (+) Transcript_48420:1318-1581(+)